MMRALQPVNANLTFRKVSNKLISILYPGPLEGHLLVDILDSAYLTFHLGLVGKKNIDMFRAEVCFKSEIKYNLNILKVSGTKQYSQFQSKIQKNL